MSGSRSSVAPAARVWMPAVFPALPADRVWMPAVFAAVPAAHVWMPVVLAVVAAGCTGGAASSDGSSTVAVPLEVRFVLDEAAFTAPPAPQNVVPFDVVAADMDADGDPDLLVNWHNLARLELFENEGGGFVLVNPESNDRSGLYENVGVASLYAEADRVLAAARADGAAGVYVWHEPNPRGDWHFYVAPAAEPATIELRANGALTPRLDERFVRRRGEFDAELRIDTALHFRVGVAFVATQLVVSASLPVFAGAELTPVGNTADLWKDDPHGIAWVNVRGTPAPEIFISRGGLMGQLLPPHDAKVDRFFEYTGADPMYEDARDAIPAGYGRGRRVEWVDIDADGVNELYIGNTDSPNALLAVDGSGSYTDIAPALGLDVADGDTFAWLDVDGDGRDDLVFVDAAGFSVAYNRGDRAFELAPGSDIGLRFPPGSEPGQESLFATLSLNVLDVDNDGRLDLWLTGHGEGRKLALYRGTDAGFADATAQFGLDAAPLANRIVFLDIENDGYIDAMTFGASATWLHNEGGARFRVEEVDPAWGLREFTHAAAIDVDDDALLDLVLVGHRRMVARNRSRGAGSALRVLPRTSADDPVGALVMAFYADGMVRAQRYGSALTTQYSQGLAPLRFGIPPGTSIDRLEVRWPDGRTETRAVGACENFIELQH